MCIVSSSKYRTMAIFVATMALVSTYSHAKEITTREKTILSLVAEERKLNYDEKILLFAIRSHENGKPGKECGVLSYNANYYGDGFVSLIIQADAATWIIRKYYKGSLREFAKIYAPIGAKNDPTNLNQCWYAEVRKWMKFYKNKYPKK